MTQLSKEVWNALPIEERERLNGCLLEIHIREIKVAKNEAINSHNRHMASLDDRLKSLELFMAEWESSQVSK